MAGFKDNLLSILNGANMDLVALLSASHALQAACLACADSGQLVQDNVLNAFIQGTAHAIEHKNTPAKDLPVLILTLMALTAAQHGRTRGFRLGLQASLVQEMQAADTTVLSRLMRQEGWFSHITEVDIKTIGTDFAIEKQPNEGWAFHTVTKTLDFLGFGTERDLVWLKPIRDHVALPWLTQALEKGYTNTALVLERRLYMGWVSAYEVMDHYNESLSLWSEQLHQLGRNFSQSLPSISKPERARPLMGIFVYNPDWLAHVDLLYQTLRLVQSRDYDIRLYFLNFKNEETRNKFDSIGIDCVFLDEITDKPLYADRFKILRGRVTADGVSVAIWLCLPIFMPFSFGMKLAPYQIYWSMKHPVDSFAGMADDYWASINAPGDTAKFYDLTWSSLPVTYAPYDAPDMEEVHKIRGNLPANTVVLGTLARADKLNSPDFLCAVCDILRAHPNALYMYTGKKELPSIKAFFEKEGVYTQTKFIGWVNPRLYAQVFDIYIDCWPARSGMTAYAALEAEKPLVINVAPNANHDFVRLFYFYFQLVPGKDGYHLPDPVLDADFTLPDGNRALLACESRADYVAMVGKLIEDPGLRKAYGTAGRALCAWLNDSTRAGQKIDKLFREAIQKALS